MRSCAAERLTSSCARASRSSIPARRTSSPRSRSSPTSSSSPAATCVGGRGSLATAEIGPNSLLVDREVGAASRVWMSVLEGAIVGERVEIGPFSHLRPGAVIEDGAQLGNFAEVKASRIGAGTQMHHFSYVGDAGHRRAGEHRGGHDHRQLQLRDARQEPHGRSRTMPRWAATRCWWRRFESARARSRAPARSSRTTFPSGEVWVGAPARPLRRAATIEPASAEEGRSRERRPRRRLRAGDGDPVPGCQLRRRRWCISTARACGTCWKTGTPRAHALMRLLDEPTSSMGTILFVYTLALCAAAASWLLDRLRRCGPARRGWPSRWALSGS